MSLLLIFDLNHTEETREVQRRAVVFRSRRNLIYAHFMTKDEIFGGEQTQKKSCNCFFFTKVKIVKKHAQRQAAEDRSWHNRPLNQARMDGIRSALLDGMGTTICIK